MKLHFQRTPMDLFAIVAYAVVMAAVLFALGVGDLAGTLLVLFAPGYVLVAALFPRNEEIGWVERIGLSFGLTIAVVPLLGLFLNFTPWGIRFTPMVATITIFTAGVSYVAYRRRMQVPAGQRLSLTIDLVPPGWSEYTVLDKALSIALTASIVVAAGTLAYVLLTPRMGERFTEFYLLGPGGNASDYPTRLNVSDPGIVSFSVVNHEFATVNYTVRVDLAGVTIAYNTSCGCNQTREIDRTSIAWFNRSLGDTENWTQRYTFWINTTGVWKLEFLLSKDAALTAQNLHLFIRVP